VQAWTRIIKTDRLAVLCCAVLAKEDDGHHPKKEACNGSSVS